jgi:hypothetical protein
MADKNEQRVYTPDALDTEVKQPKVGDLHPADQTSYAGPEIPPLNRPPVATNRPDVPIVDGLTVGAGEHPADEHVSGAQVAAEGNPEFDYSSKRGGSSR